MDFFENEFSSVQTVQYDALKRALDPTSCLTRSHNDSWLDNFDFELDPCGDEEEDEEKEEKEEKEESAAVSAKRKMDLDDEPDDWFDQLTEFLEPKEQVKHPALCADPSPILTTQLRIEGRLQINNITSTFALKQRGRNEQVLLPLRALACGLSNTEYDRKKFSAVIVKQREPSTTFLLFGSGKCVVTGAKTIDDSQRAARKMAKKIARIVPNIVLIKDSFKIQNIASSFTMQGVFSNMSWVACNLKANRWFVTFEPELFPAAVVKYGQERIRFLVYNSGKVVLTGCKCEADVGDAFDNIYPVLKFFSKDCDSLIKRDQDDIDRYHERHRKMMMMRYFKYNGPLPSPSPLEFKDSKCLKKRMRLSQITGR